MAAREYLIGGEPPWVCERCGMTLAFLHNSDSASYSAAAQSWGCIPCTRETKQHVSILRPSGNAPERRHGS
ncbi:MAG: hypothetical protein ACREA0_01655, partial [bacterium]